MSRVLIFVRAWSLDLISQHTKLRMRISTLSRRITCTHGGPRTLWWPQTASAGHSADSSTTSNTYSIRAGAKIEDLGRNRAQRPYLWIPFGPPKRIRTLAPLSNAAWNQTGCAQFSTEALHLFESRFSFSADGNQHSGIACWFTEEPVHALRDGVRVRIRRGIPNVFLLRTSAPTGH